MTPRLAITATLGAGLLILATALVVRQTWRDDSDAP